MIVYATQTELIERLDRAGIPYFNYEHKALPDITDDDPGARRARSARRRAADALASRHGAIARRDSRQDRRAAAAGDAARVRARPASLRNIYASGGYGFLHDMLEIAGGRNVFGDVKQQAVRPAPRCCSRSKPEVIIELRYGDSLKNADIAKELRAWDALPRCRRSERIASPR